MSHTRLWVAAAIIAGIIIVGFVLSVPHTRDIGQILAQENVAAVPSVALHDSFKKGLHTITGSVTAPDACTTVTAQASIVGSASSTESIQIALSLPSDTGVCLEVPTSMNFSTAIVAPAHVPLTVTVNGIAASTTSS